MKIGKLYKNNGYFWLLYPSKDIAADAADAARCALGGSAAADYWRNRFNDVSHIESNSIFMLLEQDGKCYKVLTANGEIGWFYLANWCKKDIEEVNQ
jgi:hypothetical protein